MAQSPLQILMSQPPRSVNGGYDPYVPPYLQNRLRRQDLLLDRMGYEEPEPVPSGWETFFDALSTPEYAAVNALDYYRQGKNPLIGFGVGAYEGLRPLLRKGLSYIPGGRNVRVPKGYGKKEYWPDYLQTIPGLEPTESTWGNFGVRLGGVGLSFLTDPLSYLAMGSEGVLKQGAQAMARAGMRFNVHYFAQQGPAELRGFFRLVAETMVKEEVASGGMPSFTQAKMLTRENQLVRALEKEWTGKNGPLALEPWFLPRKARNALRIPLVSHAAMEKTGLPALGRAVFSPRGTKTVKEAVEPWMELYANVYNDPQKIRALRKVLFREETVTLPRRGKAAVIHQVPTQPPGNVPGALFTTQPNVPMLPRNPGTRPLGIAPTALPPYLHTPGAPTVGYHTAPILPRSRPITRQGTITQPSARMVIPGTRRPAPPPTTRVSPVSLDDLMLAGSQQSFIQQGARRAVSAPQKAITFPELPPVRKAGLTVPEQRGLRPTSFAAQRGEDLLEPAARQVPSPTLAPEDLLRADAISERQLSRAKVAAQSDLTSVKPSSKPLTLKEWRESTLAEAARLGIESPSLVRRVQTATKKDIPVLEKVLESEFAVERKLKSREWRSLEAERVSKSTGEYALMPARPARTVGAPGATAKVPQDTAKWAHIADDIQAQIETKMQVHAKQRLAETDIFNYDSFLDDLSDLPKTARAADDYSDIRQQVYAKLKANRGKPLSEINFGNDANPLRYAPEELAEKTILQAEGKALEADAKRLARERGFLTELHARNAPELSLIRGASSKEELAKIVQATETQLKVDKALPEGKRAGLNRAIRAAYAYVNNEEWAARQLNLSVKKPGVKFSVAEAVPTRTWADAQRTSVALDDALRSGSITEAEHAAVSAALDASSVLRKNIEVKFVEGAPAVPPSGLLAHGEAAGVGRVVKGHADIRDTGKSIISITKHGLSDPETMHHEVWHFAHNKLLLPKERTLLNDLHKTLGKKSPKVMEEWAADEYAKFMLGKPFEKGLFGVLKTAARRMWRILRAIVGDKSAKLQTVFGNALRRPYLPVPGPVRARVILQAVPKFSIAPGVTVAQAKPSVSLTTFERKQILYTLDSAITWLSPTWRISPLLTEAGRTLKAREIQEKEVMLQAVEGFFKKFEGKSDDLNEFYKFIEPPDPNAPPRQFTADQLRKFPEAKKIWDQWFDKRIGIIPNMLRNKGMSDIFLDDYIAHVYRIDPEEYSRLLDLRTSGSLSQTDKHTLPRDIPSIDAALKKDKKPLVNAADLMGIRIESAFRAIRKVDYLNDLIQRGVPSGLLKPLPKRATEQTLQGNKDFEGYGIHTLWPQLAREVKVKSKKTGKIRVYVKGYALRDDVYINLQHVFEGFRQPHFALDILWKMTKFWKPLATIYSPKYHLRNMWGNLWNSFLGGLHNPVRYLQGLALQSEVFEKALGSPTFRINGETFTTAQLRAELKAQGISGKGFFGTDIESLIHERILGKQLGKFDIRKFPEGARRFGQFIEDNARASLYLNARLAGESPVEAANRVRKFLFDYDHLTPSERRIRDYIFPWYTWARKNVPLQIEQMLRTPGKFAAIPKVQSLFETRKEREMKEELAPDWMKQTQAFSSPLFGRTAKGEVRFIMPGMPYEDVVRFSDPKELINQLNPMLKGGLEQALSMDFFSGRPFYLEGLKNDPAYWAQRVESGWANKLTRPLWPLLGIRQYKDPDSGETITVANPRLVHLWKLAFRPGRELMQITDQNRDRVTTLTNWSTGMSVFPLDIQRAGLMKAYERRTRNEAVLKQLYRFEETPYRQRRTR